MAKKYLVRVSAKWRFPIFRSAGREFSKDRPIIVHEGDAGAEEILSCEWLEAEEIEQPEAEIEQPELEPEEEQLAEAE
jgi:hypothetical protein